jgi:ABC-type amino acid transport substrate-binding protein
MWVSKKFLVLVLCIVVGLVISGNLTGQAFRPVLEKVKETGVISIGMREDARPFAYVDERGEHVGFSIDMAWLLVKKLEEYAGKPVRVEGVPVTAPTRVPLVVNGTIDIEMSSTTHTAPRDDVVDFSEPFFISETTFMVRAGEGIRTLTDLNGKIVGAARGTTNLAALQKIIEEGVIKPAGLVIVESHTEGLLALETRKIDAYFTDTSLLMGLRASAKNPEAFEIILESIHAEPYGWMMRENDSDWRDFVNHLLIWTLQTKCVDELATLSRISLVVNGTPKDIQILSECKDPAFTIYDAIYDKWMGPESAVPIPRSAEFNAVLKGIQWPDVLSVWPVKK